MLDDFGGSKVTIEKANLLKEIKANRKSHEEEYQQAHIGYRAKSIDKLILMLADAKAGRPFKTTTEFIEPVSHLKDYDRVIKMLEMSTADSIVITENQFSQYVQDEWAWSSQFKTVSTSYRG
jgi:uncharacterized short protein YbdD (DUF466 family)